MNNPWLKILVFGLLFGIGGFLIGRCCGGGGCHKGGGACHGQSMCDHGGGCCSEGGGHCDKEGCDHKMGGACCKGDMHGESKGACCKGGHEGGHGHMEGHGHDDKVHVIIDGLKEKNFQGDTTISIDGGTVHVTRTGEKMEVKVELSDSVKVEEKTVEVHAH